MEAKTEKDGAWILAEEFCKKYIKFDAECGEHVAIEGELYYAVKAYAEQAVKADRENILKNGVNSVPTEDGSGYYWIVNCDIHSLTIELP